MPDVAAVPPKPPRNGATQAKLMIVNVRAMNMVPTRPPLPSRADVKRASPLGSQPCDIEARRARHLDVEEHGVELAVVRKRFPGVRCVGNDVHVVVRREQESELRSSRPLVVDDERADHSTGTSRRTTVPNGNERSFTPSP